MSIIRRLFIVISCTIFISILSGCMNKQNPVEKMYETLEKVVISEKVFEEQQDPLVRLENEEQTIYEKIISLGMKESNEIASLADEAITIIDKKREHLEKEQESLKASKVEFETISPFIEELKEPELKDTAQKLYNIMLERYNAYEELHQQYMTALQLDQELYSMFKQESAQLDKLQDQIEKINDKYKEVLQSSEQFNDKTKEYNDMKLSFYKQSGMDINVDSEES